MDVRSGCRSADEISPAFVHGDHRLCGIQNHRAETSGGARRTFLRSIQNRDEDAVGTHRLGEEQAPKTSTPTGTRLMNHLRAEAGIVWQI